MVNVVYAAPPAPPPAPPVYWGRMGLEWVGWDGSVWELSNWRSGVFVTKDGVEGLSRPPHTDWLAPLSPSLHGQEFTGYVVEARPVFWPIYLYSDKSADDWRRLDAAFWKTMDPGKYGTWRVSTTGGTRELRCRFQDDGGHSYENDPHAFGWQRYGISLIADDPFWTGEPITQSWKAGDGRDFFNGPDKAPLFHISSASVISSAKMRNPGDREAWPVWSVKGPTSLVSLGANGKQVTAPFPIAEGQTLTIDTDPRDQTAWLDGVDVTDQLGKYDFAPIPAGAEVPLSLAMTGTGVVTATITPRYDRAWGGE